MLHVAAYDPRVKAVVSQVGAMDVHQITLAAVGAEQFAALEQLTVQERVRHATEGGEVYIPDIGLPGQGFALQTDQDEVYPGEQATQIAALLLQDPKAVERLFAQLVEA